jgi:hypothetical protein
MRDLFGETILLYYCNRAPVGCPFYLIGASSGDPQKIAPVYSLLCQYNYSKTSIRVPFPVWSDPAQ